MSNQDKKSLSSNKVFNNIKQELRKTHFQLGNNSKSYIIIHIIHITNLTYFTYFTYIFPSLSLAKSTISQYKQDYTPKKGETKTANMDSVTLRKTHFILGDNNTNYNTSQIEQSKFVDPKGQPMTMLSAETRADLRKSHFSLGNFQPTYLSSTKSEYTNKGLLNNNNSIEASKYLRKHNHVLGSDEPVYQSEMQSRYNNPNQVGFQKQVVSTAELQKNHYVFGCNNDPWKTTSQTSYCPKDIPNFRLHSKNLTKTNFILGEDQQEMKSVSHNSFVPYKNIGYNQENKELSKDLRQHHFKLGNDNLPMNALSHLDYKPIESGSYKERFKPTINHNLLKKSNFTIGDPSQALNDHYDSIYKKTMTNISTAPTLKAENLNNKSSVIIKENVPMSYMTENKSK